MDQNQQKQNPKFLSFQNGQEQNKRLKNSKEPSLNYSNTSANLSGQLIEGGFLSTHINKYIAASSSMNNISNSFNKNSNSSLITGKNQGGPTDYNPLEQSSHQSKRVQKLRTACYSSQMEQRKISSIHDANLQNQKIDKELDLNTQQNCKILGKEKEKKQVQPLEPYKISAQQSLIAHQNSYQNLNKESNQQTSKLINKEKAMHAFTKSMQTLEKLKSTYNQKNSNILTKSHQQQVQNKEKPIQYTQLITKNSLNSKNMNFETRANSVGPPQRVTNKIDNKRNSQNINNQQKQQNQNFLKLNFQNIEENKFKYQTQNEGQKTSKDPDIEDLKSDMITKTVSETVRGPKPKMINLISMQQKIVPPPLTSKDHQRVSMVNFTGLNEAQSQNGADLKGQKLLSSKTMDKLKPSNQKNIVTLKIKKAELKVNLKDSRNQRFHEGKKPEFCAVGGNISSQNNNDSNLKTTVFNSKQKSQKITSITSKPNSNTQPLKLRVTGSKTMKKLGQTSSLCKLQASKEFIQTLNEKQEETKLLLKSSLKRMSDFTDKMVDIYVPSNSKNIDSKSNNDGKINQMDKADEKSKASANEKLEVYFDNQKPFLKEFIDTRSNNNLNTEEDQQTDEDLTQQNKRQKRSKSKVAFGRSYSPPLRTKARSQQRLIKNLNKDLKQVTDSFNDNQKQIKPKFVNKIHEQVLKSKTSSPSSNNQKDDTPKTKNIIEENKDEQKNQKENSHQNKENELNDEQYLHNQQEMFQFIQQNSQSRNSKECLSRQSRSPQQLNKDINDGADSQGSLGVSSLTFLTSQKAFNQQTNVNFISNGDRTLDSQSRNKPDFAISSKQSSHCNSNKIDQSFKSKQNQKFAQSCQQFNLNSNFKLNQLLPQNGESPSIQDSEADFDQYNYTNIQSSKRNQTIQSKQQMEISKQISIGQSASKSTSRKEDQYLFTFNKLGTHFMQTQTAGFKTNSSQILNSTMKTTAKLQQFNMESESQNSQKQQSSMEMKKQNTNKKLQNEQDDSLIIKNEIKANAINNTEILSNDQRSKQPMFQELQISKNQSQYQTATFDEPTIQETFEIQDTHQQRISLKTNLSKSTSVNYFQNLNQSKKLSSKNQSYQLSSNKNSKNTNSGAMKSILEKNKSLKIKQAVNDDQMMHDEDLSVYEDDDCENSDLSNSKGDVDINGQSLSGYRVIKQMEDSRGKNSSKNQSGSLVINNSDLQLIKRQKMAVPVQNHNQKDQKHNTELRSLLNQNINERQQQQVLSPNVKILEFENKKSNAMKDFFEDQINFEQRQIGLEDQQQIAKMRLSLSNEAFDQLKSSENLKEHQNLYQFTPINEHFDMQNDILKEQMDPNMMMNTHIPDNIIQENIVFHSLIDQQFKGKQRPSSMIVFKTNSQFSAPFCVQNDQPIPIVSTNFRQQMPSSAQVDNRKISVSQAAIIESQDPKNLPLPNKKRKSRPITSLCAKKANLPQCFLQDPVKQQISNQDSKRIQSAQTNLNPIISRNGENSHHPEGSSSKTMTLLISHDQQVISPIQNYQYQKSETADHTEITPEQQMILDQSLSYGMRKGNNQRPESSYGKKKNRFSPPTDYECKFKKTQSDLKSQQSEVYDLNCQEFKKVFSTPKIVNVQKPTNPNAKKPPRIQSGQLYQKHIVQQSHQQLPAQMPKEIFGGSPSQVKVPLGQKQQ